MTPRRCGNCVEKSRKKPVDLGSVDDPICQEILGKLERPDCPLLYGTLLPTLRLLRLPALSSRGMTAHVALYRRLWVMVAIRPARLHC